MGAHTRLWYSLAVVGILILLSSAPHQNIPLKTNAESPSFVRQQIEDDDHDFITYDRYLERFVPADLNCTRFSSPTDIKSVSYISNGTMLVATIWLNAPSGASTRNYESPKNMTVDELASLKHIVYGMYVDVDSVYETGVDYIMNVYRNNTVKTWGQQLIESSSPSAKFFEPGRNSFEIGDQYITLSFDLETINYPENARLVFATRSNPALGDEPPNDCELVDITTYVTVPPPQFQISSSPNPLELRPGEEKTVQLQIKSDANIDSVASVTLNGTENVRENEIQSNITSKLISIRPFGNGTTTLSVKAPDQATIKPHRLPVLVDISTTGTIQLPGRAEGPPPPNPRSALISKDFDLTVNVLPGPDSKEHLDNFAAFISPLNSIWTFLAAIGVVVIPLIIRKKQKDQKEKEQKKDNS